MAEISEQASDHMASSRLIEEDTPNTSPKILKLANLLEVPAKGLDTPGRSNTTKIESKSPRIPIDEVDINSLSPKATTNFILTEKQQKSSSRSSEGGKTPLFGAKGRGIMLNENTETPLVGNSELSMKDIAEDLESESH